MNTTPELTKCSCYHCGGHLEFETAYAGKQVACPHCGDNTLLYIPATATPPPVPYSSPTPTNPAVQPGYRLADATSPRTPAAPLRPVARSRSAPPHGTNPFAPQAATASCVSSLFAFGFAYFGRDLTGQIKTVLALAVVLFLVIGFSLGIIALFGIRQHGTRGILIPGCFGTAVNGLLLGMFCVAFYSRLVTRLTPGPGSFPTSVNPVRSAQSVSPAPVAGTLGETKPPKPGERIVRLLEAGAEPRKVLRLRPKAGDKQTVAFTMKMAMEPGPLTNWPPIVETTEITVKKVFPNGDIAYESVIKDVSVLDGSGATAKVTGDMRTAFSIVKGLITSGVVSSRGFSRGTQIKNPRSDRPLPAIVRLFHGQMHMALDTIVLPEEAVGAGGRWELRKGPRDGVERTVCDIGSIEAGRVTIRTMSTGSESKQNAEGPVTIGEGSGEMTIDLARIMPPKGNLAYRMEGSGPDGSGGTEFRMKMRMELRIEAK